MGPFNPRRLRLFLKAHTEIAWWTGVETTCTRTLRVCQEPARERQETAQPVDADLCLLIGDLKP